MTERLRESLSALMDDEANELELERVLARIGEDQQLRQVWMRYNAVRAVATGHDLAGMQGDISARVREALEAEGRAAGLRWRGLLRPVASFAVAASVAATVVIGGQQLYQLGDQSQDEVLATGVSPVGLVNSLGASSVRASYGTQAMPVLQPATRTAYRELARQRMDRFSQEHAEHAALNTPQGLIPFARVPQIQE